MPDTPLNKELVEAVLENFKKEPSEQLREMLAQPDEGLWSPEALEAARLVLDQRSKGKAAEPKCRTVPDKVRAQPGPSQGHKTGDLVLVPGFSLPRGFSRFLFLARFLTQRWFYPGTIGEIRGRAAYIYYHNGNRGWVRLKDVKPFAIDVGNRLYIYWRGQTGAIIRWRDEEDQFYVRYDDGYGEWIPLKEFVLRSENLSLDS